MATLQRHCWPAWRIAVAAAILVSIPHVSIVAQQPCNPVIDGTYCATQMPRQAPSTRQSGVTMSPIEDLGSAISGTPTSPATLGGISFRGGTTCIGLLRRGACN
jgi:hypothetical protein